MYNMFETFANHVHLFFRLPQKCTTLQAVRQDQESNTKNSADSNIKTEAVTSKCVHGNKSTDSDLSTDSIVEISIFMQ